MHSTTQSCLIFLRDSKLTRILEDSIGGNCKTTMMAMISPALEAYSGKALDPASITWHTCRLSSCASSRGHLLWSGHVVRTHRVQLMCQCCYVDGTVALHSICHATAAKRMA